MKSSIYKIAVTLVVIIGITACSKTTKGKFTNEWKTTQFEVNYEYNGKTGLIGDSNPNLSSSNEKVDGDASSYSVTGDDGTYLGNIQQFEISINKDGSYSEILKFTSTEMDTANNPVTVTNNVKIEGIWSFMSKNKSKDLKKNERVHFTPTKISFARTSKMGTNNLSFSGKNSSGSFFEQFGIFLPGNYGGSYWTVDESTRKKLVLKTNQGEKYSQIQGDGDPMPPYEINDNYKVTMSITLEKK